MRVKELRSRIGFDGAAIFFGMLLLLVSMGGLYFDSLAASVDSLTGGQPGHNVKVLRRVYHPSVPTLTPWVPALPPAPLVTQPAQAQPTSAPAAQPAQALPPAATLEPDAILAPGTPAPTASPQPQALAPDRIVIPAIQLDAPVVPAGYQLVEIDGQVYQQWGAPDEFAAGWQETSAFLGVPGNTVLNGHNNIYGMVFGRLMDLTEGDTIQVYSGEQVFTYVITNKLLLQERGEPLSVRLDNARWMQSTSDERLTLVTCWPLDSNTHRLFIVARQVSQK
jgi:LPXTG-site transpeptidase (sortase) family protein